MKIKSLVKAVDLFAKLAASPEFFQLRNPLGKKLHADLWIGNRMAVLNSDMNGFAIFDNKIKKSIKSLDDNYGVAGGFGEVAINIFYLSNPRTQELIKSICDSYDRNFPGIKSADVLNHLEKDGSLDPKSGAAVDNPIFILIHDLIHQIIEHDFIKQLEDQQDDEGDEVITLMDQLNEDLASTLSGFQPSAKNTSQGLVAYIKFLFNRDFRENSEFTKENLESVINRTFHIAKAELRGKLEKLKSNLTESYVGKTKTVPPKVKQLVDGTLSKLKKEMTDKVDNIIRLKSDIGYRKTYNSVWEAFELQDVLDEYNQKIIDSSIIEQSDSSALRRWMVECLSKMNGLLNYFENVLPEEIESEYNSHDDEDD